MSRLIPPAAPSAAGFVPCYKRVQALARRAFRAVRCPQTRDDLRAEAAALAWGLFVGGGPDAADPSSLARRAVEMARAGRTLCGASA